MNEFGLAVGLLEGQERRRKDRRVSACCVAFPERRRRSDRRLRYPAHWVPLEEEEIASLLGPPYEL